MAYKIGKCCQCSTRIAVQDANGMFVNFKDCYRNADLFFDIYKTVRLEEDGKIMEKEIIVENGHRVKVAICKDCLEKSDMRKILDELTDVESQAGSDQLKTFIKLLGEPKKIERAAVL